MPKSCPVFSSKEMKKGQENGHEIVNPLEKLPTQLGEEP
jgi:hypothetical protein